MEMETLARVSSIGFRVSIVLFLIGLILTALVFWKMNIREVYLIRSGKARRRTIDQLEAQNRETGKLTDLPDLDYTSGPLKNSKKLGKKTEKTEPESPFKKSTHSGNTGKFSTPEPAPAPVPKQPQKSGESARTQEYPAAEKTAPDPEQTGETVQLDNVIPSTSNDYNNRIKTAYNPVPTGDLSGNPTASERPPEPTVPVNITSCELIIHTDEIIEI